MRVEKTEVDVVTAPSEAVGGAKIDPEQRPVLTTDTVLNQSSQGEAMKRGELRADAKPGIAEVGVETKHVRVESALEVADYLAAGQCGNCRFFDVHKGQEVLERCKHGDASERKVFTQAREMLSQTVVLELMGGSIFMDDRDEERLRKIVGSELQEIGQCRAHSAILKDDLLQMPEGTCLDAGLPNLFEANDAEVERKLREARDTVLKTAADSKD